MIPVLLVCFLIRKNAKITAHKVAQFCMRIWMKGILWLSGTRVTVRGMENVDAILHDGTNENAALFVSNHRGVFDIVVAYAYTRPLLAFIGKKEARLIPLVGPMMTIMNGLFLDRDSLRQGLEVILKASDLIHEDGISVWVCPEGTRSKGDDESQLLPFRPGCFKAATKTGAPIIPVFISGTREIFEAHKPFVRATDVTITYGAPVFPDELTEEDRKHIAEYFQAKVLELKNEHVNQV